MIKESNKISIAVAFLKCTGVTSILQVLKERENFPEICFITGRDFGITDVEALRELLKRKIPCRIISQSFHPKIYIFEKDNYDATVFVGSSNLSEGGLSTNYEANLTVQGRISESPIKEIVYYFSSLFSESAPLDEQFIKDYAEYKYKRDSNTKKLNEDLCFLKEKVDRALDNSKKQEKIKIELEKSKQELEKRKTESTSTPQNIIFECTLSKTAVDSKFIYINAPYRKYFPPLEKKPNEKSAHSKKLRLFDSDGKMYEGQLEESYRITGITKLFGEHKFKVGKIKIEVLQKNEIYHVYT